MYTHLASTLRQIVLKFRKKKNLQKFGRELVKGAPSKVWAPLIGISSKFPLHDIIKAQIMLKLSPIA